jgi:hypothetical protein
MENGKIGEQEAPDLPQLNGLLVSVLIVIGVIAALGLYLTLHGNLWGVPNLILALLMVTNGFVTHPGDPQTAGLLTLWGKPIKVKSDGKTLVVGGSTILCPYFPIFLDSIKIELTVADKEIPVKLMSKDGQLCEGKISLSLYPDIHDLNDYIQAGKMENIFKIVDEIVFQEAQKTAKDMEAREIAEAGEKIVDAIEKKLEGKKFGVLIKKLNTDIKMPTAYQKAVSQHEIEMRERESDGEEYRTVRLAATELLAEYRKDPNLDHKTLDDCVAVIRALNQIKKGNSILIDASSGITVQGPLVTYKADGQRGENNKSKKGSDNE